MIVTDIKKCIKEIIECIQSDNETVAKLNNNVVNRVFYNNTIAGLSKIELKELLEVASNFKGVDKASISNIIDDMNNALTIDENIIISKNNYCLLNLSFFELEKMILFRQLRENTKECESGNCVFVSETNCGFDCIIASGSLIKMGDEKPMINSQWNMNNYTQLIQLLNKEKVLKREKLFSIVVLFKNELI